METVSTLLHRAAAKSGIELFAAYGVALSERSAPSSPRAGTDDAAFISIAGFGGQPCSGYIVLGVSERLLRRSNQTASPSADWMAELANQYLGRIKNQLLREGILIQRVPPVVFRGDASLLFQPPRGVAPIALCDQTEAACFWVVNEPSPDSGQAFVPSDSEPDVLSEGDLVLF